MRYSLIACLIFIFHPNYSQANSSLETCQNLNYSGIDSVKKIVSPKAFEALENYKSIGFSSMNSRLRNSSNGFDLGYYIKGGEVIQLPSDRINLDIHLLDTVFYSLPILPSNVILFRGVSLGYRNNEPYRPSDIFREASYVSTSMDIKVAEKFSHSRDSINGQVMAIYFSTGLKQKGIPLCDEQEVEVLLPRKLEFKVMDEVSLGDNTTLSLVQVCKDYPGCDFDINKDVIKVWDKIKREKLDYQNE